MIYAGLICLHYRWCLLDGGWDSRIIKHSWAFQGEFQHSQRWINMLEKCFSDASSTVVNNFWRCYSTERSFSVCNRFLHHRNVFASLTWIFHSKKLFLPLAVVQEHFSLVFWRSGEAVKKERKKCKLSRTCFAFLKFCFLIFSLRFCLLSKRLKSSNNMESLLSKDKYEHENMKYSSYFATRTRRFLPWNLYEKCIRLALLVER